MKTIMGSTYEAEMKLATLLNEVEQLGHHVTSRTPVALRHSPEKVGATQASPLRTFHCHGCASNDDLGWVPVSASVLSAPRSGPLSMIGCSK